MKNPNPKAGIRPLVRKKFNVREVRMGGVDPTYSPDTFWIILCGGNVLGDPIIDQDEARKVCAWMNTVQYEHLEEDRALREAQRQKKD